MNRRLRISTCICALALAASMVGCGNQGDGSDAAPPATPTPAASEGETLVQRKCSMCHTLDRVNDAEKDRAQWEQTVSRMEVNGLVVTDEEKSLIIDYLSSR